jgi:hypothetical protein
VIILIPISKMLLSMFIVSLSCNHWKQQIYVVRGYTYNTITIYNSKILRTVGVAYGKKKNIFTNFMNNIRKNSEVTILPKVKND